MRLADLAQRYAVAPAALVAGATEAAARGGWRARPTSTTKYKVARRVVVKADEYAAAQWKAQHVIVIPKEYEAGARKKVSARRKHWYAICNGLAPNGQPG
jgi:hypothetical protein